MMAHYGNEPSAPVPDVVASLIRTWVPIGVGALLAWLASERGIVIDETASTGLGTFAAAVCAAAYYAIARALESVNGDRGVRRVARTVGRLMLGGLGAPTYAAH